MGDKKNELKNEELETVTGGTEIPAMQLGENAYEGMFAPCEPLVPAPGLPATQLGESCYSGMFTPLEQPQPGALVYHPDAPEATLPDRYKVHLTVKR